MTSKRNQMVENILKLPNYTRVGVYHTLLKVKSFDSLVFTQKTKVDLLNVKICEKS